MSDNLKKGFYVFSESWYADSMWHMGDIREEIMIGLYADGGGTDGEFAIRWFELGGEVVPRLEAFSDSWSVLSGMPELMQALGLTSKTTPQEVKSLLVNLGYEDRTQRERD